MANILTQIDMAVFMVIYNFYIRKLGMPETVNGQIISMASLSTALIMVPAGLISDRFGRRKVIFLSIVSWLFRILWFFLLLWAVLQWLSLKFQGFPGWLKIRRLKIGLIYLAFISR
ncbi:MFS transporter [Neobacillus terrae]|uniref:MFS transporter n=1 Tax=Neobacillus terrae TaxID=3034837 RepID=UPI003B75B975